MIRRRHEQYFVISGAQFVPAVSNAQGYCRRGILRLDAGSRMKFEKRPGSMVESELISVPT
jgi:hypothetical protein